MLAKYESINFIGGLVALLLGVSGQLLLKSNQPASAIILYLLAVGLLVVAMRKLPGPDLVLATFQPRERGKWYWWGYITGGLVIVSAGLAFWMFTTSIPPIYPWLLHLASTALLLFASAWLDGGKQKGDGEKTAWSWLEIGILLAIFAIAAFMRLYRFDQIPFGTWYDEADNGLSALKILTETGYLPVYVESTNLPAHLLYLIALSFRILGVSTLSIRAVSVIFGLATVAAALLTGQELFNRKMGFVLAFLLAVSRWDINWSRIGMHGVTVPFFELLTVGLILRALKRQRLLDYSLAGLAIGFGLCFYVPLRLFPLVIGLFFLVLWSVRHDFFRLSWRGILLIGLGAIIASIPVTQFAIQNPDAFLNRMRTTSIFEGKTSQEAWSSIAVTTREHLLMFNYHGDNNGRHNLAGEPMLDSVSGTLMVLGLGLSLWRIRQPGSFLLVAWLFLMLAPGIFALDFESPQSLRAIGSLPAAYLLAAVPIDALWKEWDKFTGNGQPLIFTIPLILVLGTAGYLNYQIYFDRQANTFDSWFVFSTPETITGRLMAELGDQVDFYISSFYYHVPTISFLAPKVEDYHKIEPHETLPIRLDGKKGVVMIVDGDRRPFYLQAKSYYPNAEFKEYSAPDGTIVLYGIFLKPADILATQGLTASYFPGANWSEKPSQVRNETNFSFDWRDGDPLTFPFGVQWQGILFANTFGLYRLTLHSPAAIDLTIDGSQITLEGDGGGEQTAEVVLAKGNHSLKLRTQAQAGHFELDWQPPSEAEGPIPLSALLLPGITNHGLLGSYYANGNWQAPPAYTQIDPWIHFYFHNPPLPRPYTVEWVGNIDIAKGGLYTFGLESIDESALYIDGEQVISDLRLNQYQEAQIELTQGFHAIRLRFTDRTSATHINIYWTPPGSDREIIPTDVLYPPEGDQALLDPQSWGNNLTNPPNPSTGPVGPGEPADMPVIEAKLLWRTGECGSGDGQFQTPHGISADPAGNIWVADTGNQRIVELNPEGKFVRSFGHSGNSVGKFTSPFDLVVETDGNLVVLDPENLAVLQRFTRKGEFQAALGSNLATYAPRGLGIDAAGNIYIADTGGDRILRISPAGELLQQWGTGESGLDFGQPVGVAAAPDGAIYIVEAVKGLVWKLLSDGKFSSWPAVSISDTLEGPHIGVGNQLIYITDPEDKRVVIYTPDGQPAGQIRARDQDAELFSKPVGITVAPAGILVVSDSALCQVLAFKLPEELLK
jgi:DNA-binding beta-propeller fold protein YncE/4-amino-4-deoxy-L-arabinose transferase-like glycosyltransferase